MFNCIEGLYVPPFLVHEQNIIEFVISVNIDKKLDFNVMN